MIQNNNVWVVREGADYDSAPRTDIVGVPYITRGLSCNTGFVFEDRDYGWKFNSWESIEEIEEYLTNIGNSFVKIIVDSDGLPNCIKENCENSRRKGFAWCENHIREHNIKNNLHHILNDIYLDIRMQSEHIESQMSRVSFSLDEEQRKNLKGSLTGLEHIKQTLEDLIVEISFD